MMSTDELISALRDLDRRPLVALTIDVEWAHPAVLEDVLQLLDERGLQATFFVTHPGVNVDRGERALHPNFFRENNSAWDAPGVRQAAANNESSYWQKVVALTRNYCPEAVGVRAHGLYSASKMLDVYREAGLRYVSSVFLPGAPYLRPTMMAAGMLELPCNYMDYEALNCDAPDLSLEAIDLDKPGLRILDFHPNLIYANHRSVVEYNAVKPAYHDPDALLANRRRPGRGVRDLFLELLDRLANGGAGSPLLREIDAAWRTRPLRR